MDEFEDLSPEEIVELLLAERREKANLKSQLEVSQEQLQVEQELRIQNQAVAFADSLIDNNKIMPSDKDDWVVFFSQLAMDDAESDSAQFSAHFTADGEGDVLRTDVLAFLMKKLPSHELTSEKIKVDATKNGNRVDFSASSKRYVKPVRPPMTEPEDDEDEEDMDDDELEAALSATDTGKAIIRSRSAGKKKKTAAL